MIMLVARMGPVFIRICIFVSIVEKNRIQYLSMNNIAYTNLNLEYF